MHVQCTDKLTNWLFRPSHLSTLSVTQRTIIQEAVIIPISLRNRCFYHEDDKSQLTGSALQSAVEQSELRRRAGRAPAPVAAPYSAVVTGQWSPGAMYTDTLS